MFNLFKKKDISIKEKVEKVPRPVVLIILDGFGISPIHENNAVFAANTPNLDMYQRKYPKALLYTAGNEVGLPYGEFGNSEVGHLNIGSGRIVYQPLLRVSNEIEAGHLENNSAMDGISSHLKKTKGNLHLLGLLSAGGVHSHIEQLYSLLEWTKNEKIKSVFIHVFTDGRDAPPESAQEYIDGLNAKITELGINAKIASISGRFYAMDRTKKWGRTKKSYDAIIGTSKNKVNRIEDILSETYKKKKTDEFLEPHIITDEKGNSTGKVENGDAIFFFNIRPDRSRQIVTAFTSHTFNSFKAKKFANLYVATLTEYDPKINANVIFPEKEIENPIGQVFAKKGFKQFRIAEAVKYPHVTYFFNGGQEKPFKGEVRKLIPSIPESSYEKKPEMNARGVTDEVLKKLKSNKFDFYLINFANSDMIGHTGNLKSAIKAVEFLDKCVAEIVNYTLGIDGAVLISADHGNSEEMLNSQTGDKDTEHNIYPAPFMLIAKDLEKEKESKDFKEMISEPIGALADIAPTILDLMNIEQPTEMTGISLLNSMK